jgi:hypothetical protein
LHDARARAGRIEPWHDRCTRAEGIMGDGLYILLTLGFFVATWLYAEALDRM